MSPDESFVLTLSRREFVLVRQAFTEYRDSPRRNRYERMCASRWLMQLQSLDNRAPIPGSRPAVRS